MFLEYKGINVFYTDVGQGNTVVLLHGFLENSSMWDPFIPEFSANNRVVCIDLLGQGKTGCLGYVHSMVLMAKTVKAVLEHLKIKQATFIGHSMGGYVALAFAERYSKAVSGLCLMNSTAKADTLEKKKNRDRAILAVKQNCKVFVRMAVSNLFSFENRTLFSEAIKNTIDNALQAPVQGVIAALEGMKIRENKEHILHVSGYKKMLIIGKKDPVLDYKDLTSQVKNTSVSLVQFPDGHMSHIENKNEFSQKIMRFIE